MKIDEVIDNHYITDSLGIKYRYFGGKLHSIDKPSRILPNGSWEWYYNGYLHRLDGPAAFDAERNLYFYWFNGCYLSTPEKWAYQILKGRDLPNDDDSIAAFLKPILAKQVKELI